MDCANIATPPKPEAQRSHDSVIIIGISQIGRVTINRLDMNDDRHDDGSIRSAHRLWMRGGWHPPVAIRNNYPKAIFGQRSHLLTQRVI